VSTTSILDLAEIERRLESIDLVRLMEEAFVAFSRGEAVVPLPGELLIEDPPGEVHIKYGYFKHGQTYVIKIASGFWKNPEQGLSSSDGLLLVFRKTTGELLAVLNDRGRLTDLRTAAAGAVAAKHLARDDVDVIGVIGTGIQAELQIQLLQNVRPCRRLILWGRNSDRAHAYAKRMKGKGFDVEIARTPAGVAAVARLIVTATASTAALLHWPDIQPGTHITAIGADSAAKQELDQAIIEKADIVVTDSRTQAVSRGELLHATAQYPGIIDRVRELGEVVSNTDQGRITSDQITVATLSGLAVQDVAIASAILSFQRAG
jgi:ornithine cyclodeaminase